MKIIRPGRASAAPASPLISIRSAIGTSARRAITSRLSPGATTYQLPEGLSGCSGARPGRWHPVTASAASIQTARVSGRRLAAAHAEAALQIDVTAAGVIRGDVMVAFTAHDRQFL